jgi:hypothetical protein
VGYPSENGGGSKEDYGEKKMKSQLVLWQIKGKVQFERRHLMMGPMIEPHTTRR